MKRRLIPIAVSAVLLAAGLILHHLDRALPALLVCTAAYLVVGWRVLWKAARNILHGKVFDENFLMAVATIGAFAVREYPEAAAVMLFYQIGEWFEQLAVRRSRNSIRELMAICPDVARRKTENGSEEVDPAEIAVGETILVYPGERIALDGAVLQGDAQLDTSALTGESVPRHVRAGESVYSGCIDLDGVLEIEVQKAFGESTVSKIMELVENSAAKKSRSESFITRFAEWYTPIVVILAVLLAVIPPLVLHQPFADWIYRALNFLVVSCPCALVISVPLSFFGGIGAASRTGILIKGSIYLESLSKASCVVMDKTGTLTEGVFTVTQTHGETLPDAELLRLAAGAERFSSHPIAAAIRGACSDPPEDALITDVRDVAGKGIHAAVCGRSVLVGNRALLEQYGADCPACDAHGTIVYAAVDGRYAGYLVVSDRLKENAAETISTLRADGLRTVMLSGDRAENAKYVAQTLGIDAVHAELLPTDKVAQLEAILQTESGKTVYVGDGINDAPVLARADVGVAMGALGSDAAIEAADIVLITDELQKLPAVLRISRKTMHIVWENIAFAIAVKVAVLALSALGLTGLWLAVFADVGVCVLAILNAMRALRMIR